MEENLKNKYAMVAKLDPKDVSVTLEEYQVMQPCKVVDTPHCHYRVTIIHPEIG